MTEQAEQAAEPQAQMVHTGAPPLTKQLWKQFETDQVDLIKATVAKDCNNAELALFLETCVRHELDPFIKEIWAVKIKGKVQIFASKDGLLGIANRHTPAGKYQVTGDGMFRGCQSGVLREHDFFDFHFEERDDETEKVIVQHSPRTRAKKPTHGGADGSKRGKIVGAWARVRRQGQDDTFFIAYWDQYYKNVEGPWRTHPDAMIQKCAESVTLRKAFSISGVIGEGELPQGTATNLTSTPDVSAEIPWPEDEQQTETLKALFKELGWRRARVRTTLNAVGLEGGDADVPALIARLNSEIDRRDSRQKATATEEDAVQDAEVVEDPESADEPAAA